MASPQTEDGYTKLANELVDKFFEYRIPGQEMQIVWVIIRKTWGYQKKWDWISLSVFEDLTHIDRRKCHVLLSSLIEKKIVTKKGDKNKPMYCFNKNYEEWKVTPKKVTRPKVSPIKVPSVTYIGVKTVTQKVTHKRNKENIQKKEALSPKKVTTQNPNTLSKHDKRIHREALILLKKIQIDPNPETVQRVMNLLKRNLGEKAIYNILTRGE